MKTEELNEKEEKVLAELDELKHTGGWHKIRIEVLKQYANEVSRDKCDGCVFSYHDKSKGSHDVEDLYKEQEGQQ